MNARLTPHRRRAPRCGSVRRAQRGSAVRGLVVATGLVAAIGLQLGGSRLQCHLAGFVGAPSAAPVLAPASTPACGSASGANPMHPCKVATATAGNAPVI